MPKPQLPHTERSRRKTVVEDLLRAGYHPQGSTGGIASATQEAWRREGINYPRWVRDEEAREAAGEAHFSVDWSVYQAPAEIPSAANDDEPETDPPTPQDHALVRADSLKGEIDTLVTSSNYPLVNPECIVVDSYVSRKYNRKLGTYVEKEGRPRTWLSDTPRVAKIEDCRGRKFIFTSAQNDAELHPVWDTLKAYADFVGAEIVVGPNTYETSWWSENNPTSRSYQAELMPYLCFGQMEIGNGFIFAGEANILATASQPISDMTTYSRSRWAVFPHQKRSLKSVPSTDPAVQAHQVMTTGSVTKPKISPRKAGLKSIFHHVAGAVIVEFDEDGDIFCRQITAKDDGSFQDLDVKVSLGNKGVPFISTGNRIDALVVGDMHIRKLDNGNALATLGFDLQGRTYRNSLVGTLCPRTVLFHDVFDNETRNHHHQNDNAHSYEMAFRGRDNVLDEIRGVSDFLARFKSFYDTQMVVVESNHDIGLDRYVREGRYRQDGLNIKTGLQLELVYMNYVEKRSAALDYGLPVPKFSLLEHAVKEMTPELKDVQWAYDGYSFLINGIEVGHHGFRGVNGAKGTVAGFARVGRKMSIADKHSPEINEGVYVAGCMNLRHGYNKGPSSWAVSHIVQYDDGSRALITLQQGKWRAQRPRIAVQARTAA